MFHVTHMDASGDDDPPVETLSTLYDELHSSGIFDGDVSVTNDDSGWCISAHRDGRVVFGHLADPNTDRHMIPVPKAHVLELWKRLIEGDIDGLLKEPWKPGYVDPDERAAAPSCAQAQMSRRPGPFRIVTPDLPHSTRLFRLRDGRFQIIQPGHMPVLISGPDHVLVQDDMARLLRDLHLEGVQLVHAVIYDPPANQVRDDYFEVLIRPVIAWDDDIDQLDVTGLRMWRFAVGNLQDVLVSPELKDRLLAAGFTTLEFAPVSHGSAAFDPETHP